MNYLNKKTVEDIDVNGKRVIVRCDLNVPIKDGKISDDKRIRESLKTIQYLIDKNAKVILISHLGRPHGKINSKYSLRPVRDSLEHLLNISVKLSKDVIGTDSKTLISSLKNGEVVLLENVRFHKEEELNNPNFAKQLASMGDIFVNDAFGTAHRAHASTAGIANYIPSVCGYLIKKEIEIIGGALQNPKRPFVVILGGAKVSDKIGVISNFIDKIDKLIIGGGMSYTFFKAMGYSIGNSICENDKLDIAKSLLEKAESKGVKILLPIDSVIASSFSNDCDFKIILVNEFPQGYMGMDIGPKTIELFSNAIKDAKTIIWNGTMGVSEFSNFSNGTLKIAQAVADTDAVSIIGGGDSAAALEKLGFADKMTHVSTGGGATLEFLEGVDLPGISCLNDK